MPATQFIDQLARKFAKPRLTRRRMVAMSAAALTVGLVPKSSAAQQATPAIPVNETGFGQQFLFVQTFTGGTFQVNPDSGSPIAAGTPAAGPHGPFLLSLGGHPGQTIYFSDRPERIVGDVATDAFVKGIDLGQDPPNAALVVENEDGQTVVAVVELQRSEVDIEHGTVVYEVALLENYTDGGLDHLIEQREANAIPAKFGVASLYIDDCAEKSITCTVSNATCEVEEVGTGTVGGCWDWSSFTCGFCNDPNVWCNQHYAACNDTCVIDRWISCTPQITD